MRIAKTDEAQAGLDQEHLADDQPPPRTRVLLAARYKRVGEWRIERQFAWATLGERGSPHDWKYTHPRLTLYRRLSQ